MRVTRRQLRRLIREAFIGREGKPRYAPDLRRSGLEKSAQAVAAEMGDTDLGLEDEDVEMKLLRQYIRTLIECGEEPIMQPIMDPLFNIREMCKEFTLLEDHLNRPDMQCHDCINKHLMKCEALAEEAISLDSENQHPFIAGIPNMIRGWHEYVLDGGSLEDLGAAIRPVRKELTPLVVDRFESS